MNHLKKLLMWKWKSAKITLPVLDPMCMTESSTTRTVSEIYLYIYILKPSVIFLFLDPLGIENCGSYFINICVESNRYLFFFVKFDK